MIHALFAGAIGVALLVHARRRDRVRERQAGRADLLTIVSLDVVGAAFVVIGIIGAARALIGS